MSGAAPGEVLQAAFRDGKLWTVHATACGIGDLPNESCIRAVEFTPTANFTFQFADTVLLVGEEEAIKQAANALGNSPKQLNHPQIVPIFVGIALGILVGSIPFQFPGIPAAVKLGLAGGPLIIAILLSRLGRVGPLIYYMPLSANFMLRELGITLFLACVGLKAGDQFVQTLTQGPGLYWMGCAALNSVPCNAAGRNPGPQLLTLDCGVPRGSGIAT